MRLESWEPTRRTGYASVRAGRGVAGRSGHYSANPTSEALTKKETSRALARIYGLPKTEVQAWQKTEYSALPKGVEAKRSTPPSSLALVHDTTTDDDR